MTQHPENETQKSKAPPRKKQALAVSPPLIVGGVLGLMVLLLGAWFMLSGNQNTTTVQQPPAPTPTNQPSNEQDETDTANPNLAAPETAPTETPETTVDVPTIPTAPTDTTNSDVPVNPSVESTPDANQIEVAVIPPFAVDAASPTDQPLVTVDALSQGINPDEPLIGVGSNPFKPLKLDKNAVTANQSPQPVAVKPPTPVKKPAATPAKTTPKTTAKPKTTQPKVDALGTRGGAIAVAPLPGTSTTIRPVQIKRIPAPVQVKKPTTSKTSTTKPKTTTKPQAAPKITLSTPKKPATTSLGGVMPTAKIPGSGFSNATKPKAPVKPPVTGMNAPGNNTASSTGQKPSQTSSKLNTPNNKPQVISELSQAPATPKAPAGPTKLESYITNNEIALNGVVLGTVNTAIFRSKEGFVVLASGQKIPETEILVKKVTATTATLELATETEALEKTLKLDGES